MALCTSLFPSGFWHGVDMTLRYSGSLIHAVPLLLAPLAAHISRFFLSPPASLPVSPMLSILPLADSIIREWYVGGHPLCHARCLRAALRSVSPPPEQQRRLKNFIHFCPLSPSLSFSLPLSCLALNIHPLCVVLKAHYTRF